MCTSVPTTKRMQLTYVDPKLYQEYKRGNLTKHFRDFLYYQIHDCSIIIRIIVIQYINHSEYFCATNKHISLVSVNHNLESSNTTSRGCNILLSTTLDLHCYTIGHLLLLYIHYCDTMDHFKVSLIIVPKNFIDILEFDAYLHCSCICGISQITIKVHP